MIGWWPKSPGGGDHDHPARRHKTDPHQPHAREIGRIGQEIKREETEQDAKRRDTDGVVKTASKELSAVIHFLETHRF